MLIQNESFVSMLSGFFVFYCTRPTATAASSALIINCRSGCDLMLMYVMAFVLRVTSAAPSAGLPLTCEPSVYTKSRGFNYLLRGLVCNIVVVCGCTG